MQIIDSEHLYFLNSNKLLNVISQYGGFLRAVAITANKFLFLNICPLAISLTNFTGGT